RQARRQEGFHRACALRRPGASVRGGTARDERQSHRRLRKTGRSSSSCGLLPMSLNGQEPVVLVRLAAGLNGDEAGAKARGDRRIRGGRELQVAITVAD